MGRPPRPPRYQPGDQVTGTAWTVVRSVGEDGFPLLSFPTPNQIEHGIRGTRVVECRCSCGTLATVYEANLYRRSSTCCRGCASRAKGLRRSTGKTRAIRERRAREPVVLVRDVIRASELAQARQAEARALAEMEARRYKEAADAIRWSERARVLMLKRNGLL